MSVTANTPRRRKERAYSVDPLVEQRVAYLGGANVIAWDLAGDRLLFSRAEWFYTVYIGTEDIVDFGRVDSVVAALDREDGPLVDISQGYRLVLIDSEEAVPAAEVPLPVVQRVIECIATPDPETGEFAVYSYQYNVEAPFVTDVRTFNSLGQTIAFAENPQPLDDAPRWQVPNAIVHDAFLFALERDDTSGTGRVVRRPLGALGGPHETLRFEEADFPHALAYDPLGNVLYVLWTRLHETYTLSALSWISGADGLWTYGGTETITFGFSGLPPAAIPYSWGWVASGGPNTGGALLWDGGEGVEQFISSGPDPGSYDPGPEAENSISTFRWRREGGGDLIENVGEGVPTPIYRTAAGVISTPDQAILPPVEIELE